MKKLTRNLIFGPVVIWAMVLVTACGGVSGSSGAGSNNGTTASTAITIDRAGIVPVFANQRTSSVIYVHNNTDHEITGITYTAIDNRQSGNTFSLSSGCNTIAAHGYCALGFTTPTLATDVAQGSAIIKASFSSGSSIQVINYQNIQDQSPDGVFVSSSIELSAPDGQVSYATVYVYGSGYNNSYVINNINLDNPAISVIDHDITGSTIRSGQVKAFEVSYDGLQSLVTKLTINSFNQSGNTFSYAANVAVSASSNGGILTSGLVPIINASNTAPTGTLYVVNSGNATSSLGTISYGSGISAGTAGSNACSSSLASGSYCIIYFNVTQAGGSANITLPYDSTNSLVQTVTWYNPVSGALLQMTANPSPIYINTDGASNVTTTITISNIGGYNITGINVSSVTTLSGNASASASGLSCGAGGTSLPVGQVCTYTITASDNVAESNKAFNLQVSGSYNNGSAQTYTRNLALPYTSLIVSTVSTNGGAFTCGITNLPNNNLNCWGTGGSGQLGNGSAMLTVPTLTTLPSGVSAFTGLSSNSNFSCAIASSGSNAGKIYCWGNGANGRIGNGSSNNANLPTSVTMPTGVTAFNQISTNVSYSCAIASAGSNNGSIYCWGTGTNGRLGNGSTSNKTVPTIVTMPGGGITFGQTYTDGAGTSCAIATNGNAYCWGLGTSGQIGNSASSTVNVPTAVTMPSSVTFTALSMPDQNVGYACAIGSNGTIYCWGSGTSGALGNGSVSNVSLPTAVTMPSGVTAFSQVMTSASSTPASLTCAIASAGANAGRIYCSGLGTSGQIGNGANSTVNVLTGVTMPSGVTAFNQLAVNSATNVCAIASAGANAGVIYCWGAGNSGGIGNGSLSNVNVPTSVTMPSGVTAFNQVYANGGANICAIASSGANAGNIYCWGNNTNGQIGNNTATSPISVPTLAILPSGATAFNQVTTNSSFSCAIASAGSNSGQIYCWGLNTFGNIGNNVSTASLVQTAATLPSGVTAFNQISSSINNICAIASIGANTGVIYCWGDNSSGQIGNGSSSSLAAIPTAVTMPSGVTAFNAISVHDSLFNCAIASAGANAGRVYCWGFGTSGQIGNGASSSVSVPTGVTMPSGVTAFNQIITSTNFACAIASAGANAGKIYCWGSGYIGELGNGNPSNPDVNVPTSVSMPSGVTAFSQVSATDDVVCAVASAGANAGVIYCWGSNGNGMIGNGGGSNPNVPTSVTMPSGVTAFSQVSVSYWFVCAIASAGANAGRVYCWGNGGAGQIGNGASSTVSVPTGVTMPSGVTAFSTVFTSNTNNNNTTVCAIASAGANSGKVYCWGSGSVGQIGNGSSGNANVPTLATLPTGVTVFSRVSVGYQYNCATASSNNAANGSNSGYIYCWGLGSGGQLGNGSATNKNVPTLAPFN